MSTSTPAPAFGRRLAKAPDTDPAVFSPLAQPTPIRSEPTPAAAPQPAAMPHYAPLPQAEPAVPLQGIGTRIPAPLARQMKIVCTTVGVTLQNAYAEAVQDWIAKQSTQSGAGQTHQQ